MKKPRTQPSQQDGTYYAHQAADAGEYQQVFAIPTVQLHKGGDADVQAVGRNAGAEKECQRNYNDDLPAQCAEPVVGQAKLSFYHEENSFI